MKFIIQGTAATGLLASLGAMAQGVGAASVASGVAPVAAVAYPPTGPSWLIVGVAFVVGVVVGALAFRKR